MSSMFFNFPKRTKKCINRHCKILASASFIPQKIITNEDLIQKYKFPFKSSAIYKSLGVEMRHVAEEHMADSDVLKESSKKCLEKIGLSPDKLSRLIVNKYYGDNLLPMTASKLLDKLGSKVAVHSFDIDGGISAFLYSIDVISRFINTGDDYILLASGGVNVRLMSKSDPRVTFLFGDASASLLFGFSEERHILASYFYTNPQYYNLAFGKAIPFALDGNSKPILDEKNSVTFDSYHMVNWKIAEKFYIEAAKEVSNNLLEESGLRMEDIDLVLVTENNRNIWELTLEALGVCEDKSISVLKSYGNTMTAMLPLLIDIGFETGRIQPGMHIMMISHGEGINGGGLIYKV